MDKPWKVILAFAGVFIAGAIFGGALAPRWLSYGHPPGPAAQPGRGGLLGGPRMLERLERELELTPAQKEKIAPIVARMEDETRRMRRESVQQFRAAMDKTNAEIAAELTPAQRAKLEDLRKRFRERLEHFRADFRGRERSWERPPPPAPDDK